MALTGSDILSRTVLYAVELVDPVSGEIVSRGLDLQPLDAADTPLRGAAPIVNRTGRFVWLQPGASWPAKLRIIPGATAPFVERVAVVAPPAADPALTPGHTPMLKPDQRLVRIQLAPSATYPFAGVTAARGALRESDQGAPVKGAVVQLAAGHGTVWTPAPPLLSAQRIATEAVTDERGEFAVFMSKLPADAEFDTKNGTLKVRLQVTRRVSGAAQTRWTPETAAPFSLPQDGYIQQGQLYPADLRLSWDRLSNH